MGRPQAPLGEKTAPSDVKWTVQIATSLGHVVYKTSPPFPRRRLAETLDTARAVRRRAAPRRSARLLGLSPSRIQVTHREPNPLFLV